MSKKHDYTNEPTGAAAAATGGASRRPGWAQEFENEIRG